jgi:membrane protease YdiL (CAAX protease family)
MTALNALLGLGEAVDIQEFLTAAAGGQATGLETLPNGVVLLIMAFQAVLLAPFLALLIAFGEEYGWRGYLQRELIKLGKIPGLLLIGIIWGLWHAPIIVMGHNYPGHPGLGVLLMVLNTIAWSFLWGYAVLRSGSVWLAAFLHGLNNQLASFLLIMVYTPQDNAFSFPIGTYGLIVWAVVTAVVILLLRRQDTKATHGTAHSDQGFPLEGSE